MAALVVKIFVVISIIEGINNPIDNNTAGKSLLFTAIAAKAPHIIINELPSNMNLF
ncbi:hypothetical protein [Clostridium gasigenes]|uniref:hypothetical protein n=1 Tax=Clostridium gasigenes TaxID=94869 RepID=UPI0033990DA8